MLPQLFIILKNIQIIIGSIKMAKFIDHGEHVVVISDNVCDITENLPVGVYSIVTNDEGSLLLKKENAASIIGNSFDDVYEPIPRYYKRLHTTFSNYNTIFGTICIGEKGTGKSMFCRYVCNQFLKEKFPIIIINQKIDLFKLSDFIIKMNNKAVFYFDEFEKLYERIHEEEEDKQIGLLSLLGTTAFEKMLFLFAINDEYKLNDFMKNRPGRIYYRFNFGRLDNETIVKYCEKNLNNKEYIDNIIKISNNRFGLSFDNLKSIVNESNTFNENPEESIEYLNISNGEDAYFDCEFNLEIYVKDFDVICKYEAVREPLNKFSMAESIFGYSIRDFDVCDINGFKEATNVVNFFNFIKEKDVRSVYFGYIPKNIIVRSADFIYFNSFGSEIGDVTMKYTRKK